MGSARECGVVPLPAVVTLRDSGVHVGGPDGSNVPAKVKGMIYQQLCFGSILRIPNVKPDDGHVRFGRSLNDPGLHCEVHRFK